MDLTFIYSLNFRNFLILYVVQHNISSSNKSFTLSDKSEQVGSGRSLSQKTSPSFKTKYIGLRNVPLRSLGQSEIYEVWPLLEGFSVSEAAFTLEADRSSSGQGNIISAALSQLSDTESSEEFKVRDMELEKDRVWEAEIEETEAVDCYTLVTTGGAEPTVAEVGVALEFAFVLLAFESLQWIDLWRRLGNPLCLHEEHWCE